MPDQHEPAGRCGRRPLLPLLTSLSVLVTVGLCSTGCREPAAAAPPPPTVTVAQPIARNVVEWDEYTGRLAASELVEVRARVSGFITEASFNEGLSVKKGDVLFVIDPLPFQAEVDRAAAEVAQAEAQVQLQTEELERLERLARTQAISEKEVLDQRYEKRAADAALAGAKASLRSAELNLGWTRVTAPIDGRISRRYVTPGNLINGGAGQATLLTTIAAEDPIYCYVEADEAAVLKYARLKRAGTRVSARDQQIPAYLALSDEEEFTREGVVDFVDNRLDPATGTLEARATFANPNGTLTPGLFARLRIAGSGRYEAVLVADEAIGTDQTRKFVIVVKPDGQTENRPVKTGALFGRLRVVEGVSPDEWIVVNGLQRIRPGVMVTPTRREMPYADALPPGTQPASTTREVPPATAPATAPAAERETPAELDAPAAPVPQRANEAEGTR